MIDFVSTRQGAEPQTVACAQLLTKVIWQAIIDASVATTHAERKARANLLRDQREAVAFLFKPGTVFALYASAIGSNAAAIRAAVLADEPANAPTVYLGLTGQQRRTLRERLHWLTTAPPAKLEHPDMPTTADPESTCIAQQPAGGGGMAVMAPRHEVMWRDGSTVQLHPVRRNGLHLHTVRAVRLDDHSLMLIDLARLLPALPATLRTTSPIDVPGVLFYSLRLGFATAPRFLLAAQPHAAGIWRRMPDGQLSWQPAAGRAWAGAPANQQLPQAVGTP